MTKNDIATRIQLKLGTTKREAADLLESVLRIIKDTLDTGENVKIAGFGVFTVKAKHARRGRNPQTGESIMLDSRRVLTFKASQILKDAVNR
jgi:integration host factor subunit alpha